MPLPFRPNCLPTALGLLPHRTARAAWEIALRHLGAVLPLPLLADSGEDPARLAVGGFGGARVVLDQLQLDRPVAEQGLDDLYLAYLQNRIGTRAANIAALGDWPQHEAQIKRADVVSTVLLGPISLGLRLVDGDGVPALTDDVLLDALAKHIYLRLRWQAATLGRSARVVLQWLYEPYLEVIGTPFSPVGWRAAGEVLDETFGTDTGVRGVWASAATDIPALLDRAAVEVVGMQLPSLDVARRWAPALRGFLQRRGVIAWGIVPQTVEGLAHARVGRLAAHFGELLQVLEEAGLPTAEVVRGSLIMPEDTLGHLYPSEAEAVLAMTSQLAGVLRHSYGLD